MITNAMGGVRSSTTVAASRKRTMGRFAARTSTSTGPTNTASRTVTSGPRTRTMNASGRMTLPKIVRLFQARPTAIIELPHRGQRARVVEMAAAEGPPAARSLVDTAHDRIEARHDRHRVGDQVVLHQEPDELEMHEGRVVDADTKRLVRAVADGVGPVHPARTLDRRERAARTRPQEPRQLRHHRPIGHPMEALVDDPQALLHLLEA